jgi:hypothetical protein
VGTCWSRVLGCYDSVSRSLCQSVRATTPKLNHSLLSSSRFSVTPGFRDIIFHLQFCSSLSMIAVLWPSFVYPIATRGAWASLIGNVTLVQSSASARFDPLSSNYAPSSASPFESEFASPSSSLYLDASAPNRLLNLDAAPGMASFAHAVGLREQDLFGTSAAIFLLICAAVVVISLTIWAIHGVGEYAMGRAERRGSHTGSPQRFEVGLGSGGGRGIGKEDEVDGVFDRKGETHQPPTAVRRQWWKFRIKGGVGAFYASSLQGNLTRILILFHLPITTFAVYQFTIYPDPASLASLVLAVFFFLFICVLIPIYLIYRLYTIPSPKLYDATRTLLSLGPLYTLYGEGSQLYAGVLLGSNIVSAAVIGGGQGSGTAQAIVLLVSEIVMSLVTSIWLPWGEGASMGATSFLLCVARIITLVLVLVLSQAVSDLFPSVPSLNELHELRSRLIMLHLSAASGRRRDGGSCLDRLCHHRHPGRRFPPLRHHSQSVFSLHIILPFYFRFESHSARFFLIFPLQSSRLSKPSLVSSSTPPSTSRKNRSTPASSAPCPSSTAAATASFGLQVASANVEAEAVSPSVSRASEHLRSAVLSSCSAAAEETAIPSPLSAAQASTTRLIRRMTRE